MNTMVISEKKTVGRRLVAGAVAFAVGALMAVTALVASPAAQADSVVDSAVSWAVAIANDNSHGYSQANRQGPDYDCSSFVSNAYAQAGTGVARTDSTYVMKTDYTNHGFTAIPFSSVGVGGLQKGDVLLVNASSAQHTALVVGRSGSTVTIVHASGTHGYPQTGDQTGQEIVVQNYWDDGWQYVLRWHNAGAASQPAVDPFANGSFILTPDGTIWSMAGGAAIPVTQWANVGGSKPYTAVSWAQFDSLRQVPTDGTAIAGGGHVYVIAGGAPIYVAAFGNVPGSTNYVTVDGVAIDNAGGSGVWSHLNKVPTNGTILNGSDGRVYVVAGGAPIYVSNWANIGGGKPYVTVDAMSIDNAGGSGIWSHLNKVPVDGTALAGGGHVYVVAGGAPIYVAAFGNVPGSTNYVTVDGVAIDNAGGSGIWSHLNKVPVNGTVLNGSDGRVYVVAGGAPIYVSNWANIGGGKPYVTVDAMAIDNAGGTGVWSHLNKVPTDGTAIAGGGHVYVIAGGAPVYVAAFGNVPGSTNYVTVDGVAIDNAGGAGIWSHLNKVPTNGTILNGSDGRVYVVAGGAPIYVSNWANIGGGKPYVTVDAMSINNAGGTGVWSHINKVPTDGTFIKGYSTGNVYKVTSGVPAQWTAAVPSGVVPVAVDQVAINNAGQSGVWSHLLK